MVHLSQSNERPYKIRRYKKLNNIINRCSKAFVLTDKFTEKCLHYCQFYKFNASSPVLEGPLGFYDNVFVQLKKYLKGTQSPNNVRLLEEKKEESKEKKEEKKPVFLKKEVKKEQPSMYTNYP